MKKREMQRQENAIVENAWEIAKSVWFRQSIEFDATGRLDYCKAWWYKTGGYVFLVSYNICVAFIDKNGVMYDILRLVTEYTANNAMHIAKFRNTFRHISEHTWREI